MKWKRLLILAMSGIVTVNISSNIFSIRNSSKDKQKEKVIEGRECLIKLENAELSKVEEVIDKHHTIIEVNEGTDVDFYNFYENTVFMGDSIAEGLIEYEIVNKYNVIAEKGNGVKEGLEKVDTVLALNPKNVVILYGMNDVITFDGGGEGGVEAYKANYIKLINELKEKLPNSNIYIQAPLPVLDKAKATNIRLTNENLKEFREITEAVSRETGVYYYNTDLLVVDNSELYEPDGIHLTYAFYEKWLTSLYKFMTSRL